MTPLAGERPAPAPDLGLGSFDCEYCGGSSKRTASASEPFELQSHEDLPDEAWEIRRQIHDGMFRQGEGSQGLGLATKLVELAVNHDRARRISGASPASARRETQAGPSTAAFREMIRKSRAFDKASVLEKLALCAALENACDQLDAVPSSPLTQEKP